ncbi:hypothetical protein [Actinokineospora sp. NBRC 105648]|uniref:hypothetical protein n=1 Tax=Actinokineospora sp. NBRC 105648 TaxID=3032206 RepID=UPI0024A1480C|nr:hypothetical protein [Actinokineospora sp. NBRC 105648]GLZ39018.1 hypothetical protein Acsp05_26420 [Actinokineospora sp. NBRC 105648]
MNERNLRVCVGLTVEDDCEMSYRVDNGELIDFLFGDRCDGFEFAFEGSSLRRFVTAATEALRILDTEFTEPALETAKS